MELNDYLRLLRRYWRGVSVLALVGVLAAGGLTILQPRVYQADASGFVSAGGSSSASEASISDLLAKSRAASYVDLATSRATARAVIADLGLTVDPAALIGEVTVTQPLDTVLIKVSARAATPRGAQALADAWVRALKRQVDTIENPSGGDKQALRIIPIESAALPTAPISPNLTRYLALGLLVGMLAGLSYAVVRNQLDQRVRDEADVQPFTVAVAASIPKSPPIAQHVNGRVSLVVADRLRQDRESAVAAEAFFKLRTNLQFMDVDHPPRVIVVTSPLPGDGKSTIAANLAAALSLADRRVVLIDGDLRRPVVAGSFGLVEGAGLTDVLVGGVDVWTALQQAHELPNLSVLAAGGTPPNPSELLGSRAMEGLLRSLADSGTTVILDAPPLLPVTDAAVLTAAADGAILVVNAGRTLRAQLGAALSSLNAVQGHVLGVVLNRVPARSGQDGYYQQYTAAG